MNWFRTLLVGLLAAVALAATPAIAAAETLFASPTGTPADPCTEADPCSLAHAVETEAGANDEVIVMAGNHPTLNADLTISHNGLTVRGESATQRPRITIDAANGVVVEAAGSMAELRDLEIIHTGGGVSLNLLGPYVIAERLRVSGEGTAVCRPSFSDNPGPFPAVLRDSVCWNAGSGDAIGISIGAPASLTWRLVNVTAAATGGSGDAIHLSSGSGCNCLINATNVIAAGNEAGGGVDVRATTTSAGPPPDIATIALDHSNFSSESETGGGVESVTNPGSGNNQTAAPIFESGAGNFHQAAGSPTIDNGLTNPLNGGALDFDGEARAQSGSQDIGADEFTVASQVALPPPPPPPPPPPGAAEVLNAKAKGKQLLLRLRCATAAGCAGNEIALRTAKKLNLKKLAAAAKRKRILLAKGSFSLVAGERRTVRLKLHKQGRKLFRARKKVRAEVTIAFATGSTTEKLKIKRK